MCRPRRLDPHRRFTTVLDPLSLDLVWPQEDRRALPRHLFDRLKVDPELRQLCGDPGRGDISAVPSSGEDAPDGEFIGHASRDHRGPREARTEARWRGEDEGTSPS